MIQARASAAFAVRTALWPACGRQVAAAAAASFTNRGLRTSARALAGEASAASPDPLTLYRFISPLERASEPDASIVARDIKLSDEHPGKHLVVRTRRKKRGGRNVRLTPRPVPASISPESEAAVAGWSTALHQNHHLSQADKDAFLERMVGTLAKFEDKEYMDYEEFFELPEVDQFEAPQEEDERTRDLFLSYAGTHGAPRKRVVDDDHLSEYYDANDGEEDEAWDKK